MNVASSPEHEEARRVDAAVEKMCATYGVAKKDARVSFHLTKNGDPQFEVEVDLPVPITRVKSIITVVKH